MDLEAVFMTYKENDVNISFRVPRELRDKMSVRAEQLGISVSKFLRNSMIEELEQGNISYAEENSKKSSINSYVLNFRCPANLYEDFIRTCEKHNVTKSNVVRQLIADYVKNNQ